MKQSRTENSGTVVFHCVLLSHFKRDRERESVCRKEYQSFIIHNEHILHIVFDIINNQANITMPYFVTP